MPATAAAAFVAVPATDDTAVPAEEATLLVTVPTVPRVAQAVAEAAGHVGDARDPGRVGGRDRGAGRAVALVSTEPVAVLVVPVVPPTPAGQAAAPRVTPEFVE